MPHTQALGPQRQVRSCTSYWSRAAASRKVPAASSSCRAPSQLTTCGPAVYTWHAAPATWLTVTGTGAGATVSVSPITANSTRLVPVSAESRSGVTRTVTLSHGPASHTARDRSST